MQFEPFAAHIRTQGLLLNTAFSVMKDLPQNIDNSEKQFQELIAQLFIRGNRSLSETNDLPPMAICLNTEGAIEILLAIELESLTESLELIQNQAKELVREKNIIATCIAFPNYEASQVIALLENYENFCVEAVLPVASSGDVNSIQLEGLEYRDSQVYVFPNQDGA